MISALVSQDNPLIVPRAPLAAKFECWRAPYQEQRLKALAVTLNDARMCGAFAGLHCYAARPFGRMCRAKPDILSFDAHEGLELFFADPEALDFLHQGGMSPMGSYPPCHPWTPLIQRASLFAG